MPKLDTKDTMERININMSKSLMDQMRIIMDQYGIGKTTAITMALKQFVDQHNAIDMIATIKRLEQIIGENSTK